MPDSSWTTSKLSQLLSEVIDYRGQSVPKSDHGVPLITARNVRDGYVDLSHKEYVAESEYDKWATRGFPKVGDILFTTEAPLGNIAPYPEGTFALGQRLVALRTNDLIADSYLYQYLRSEIGKHQVNVRASGSTAKGIKSSELKKIAVNYPRYGTEQKKIATILSTWDNAINTTEKLLANSEKQKKALMQVVLGSPTKIIKNTRVVTLADLAVINPASEASEEELVTFLAMDAVSNNAEILRRELLEKAQLPTGCTKFQENDVLVAKITPCFENGKGAFATELKDGLGFGSTEFHVIRAKAGVNPKLLFYVTQSHNFRFKGAANMQGSSGHRRVPKDFLKTFRFTIPSTKEAQEGLTALFTTCDLEIKGHRKTIQILKQEKSALMQQLLTGKRRVNTEAQL